MADELSRQSDTPVGPVDNAADSPQDSDFAPLFESHINRSNPGNLGTTPSDTNSAVLPALSIDGHAPSPKLSPQPAENKSTNDAQHPLPAIQLRPVTAADAQTLSPNARDETAYKLLMGQMESLGQKLGYRFEVQEIGSHQADSSTMHDVLIIPHQISAQ